MPVWIAVVTLLGLAVFFLFISLFLKDNQYEDELDELSESVLELHREVYSLKKKIQELEGTPIYRGPVGTVSVEEDYSYSSPSAVVAEMPEEPVYQEEIQEIKQEVVEPIVEATLEPEVSNDVTRKHILTLFSHGSSYEEIASQLNIPTEAVKAAIDSYFEESR